MKAKLIIFAKNASIALLVTGMFLAFTHTPRQAICGLIGVIVYIALACGGEE